MVTENTWCVIRGQLFDAIQYTGNVTDIINFLPEGTHVTKFKTGVSITNGMVNLWLTDKMYLVKLPIDGYIVLSEENFKTMFQKVQSNDTDNK